MSGLVIESLIQNTAYLGGTYQIIGIVTELGVVGVYFVCLFDRETKLIVQSTWSDENGVYQFANLAYHPNQYFVIAFDHGDNMLNAAIADLVTPEPMP